MKKKAMILSSLLITSVLFIGCNGDNNDAAIDAMNEAQEKANSITIIDSNTLYSLTAQIGTSFEMFYGNSNHVGLGSLANITTYNKDTNTTRLHSASLDSKYPAMTTSLTYDGNNSYTNLHVSELSYVADNVAYAINMTTDAKTTFEDFNVSGSHTKVNYLGARQYLVVTGADSNASLIAPGTDANSSVPFNHMSLEALTYQSYGGLVDGYIVLYDDDNEKETTNELQKCNLAMNNCTKIADIESRTIMSHGRTKTIYDFEILGDIADTTKSIYISNNQIVELDKGDGSIIEKGSIDSESTEYTLIGEYIYYVKATNIYRVNLDATEVTQLSSNGMASGFKAFTTDMVVYGGDTFMYAVAKDGSLKNSAIEISVTTKLTGQKYPFDLGIGDQYLFTLYSVDSTSGKNTFYACKLENAKKECKKDSYWSAVSAKRNGILNYESTYKYEPYAYIRVDTSDNYGGGKLKAIDPQHPLDDGITMGEIDVFNFQTFVNSKYDNDMIDNNGTIVLYAKNDLDFRGNAYLMNLNIKNSLVALTDEAAPGAGTINGSKSHCHGRMCTVCHSFSGGKIYSDATASSSADGYTIKFDFRDGSESVFARVRKGTGENFNTPLENLQGKRFKASVVVDGNATSNAVLETRGYSHNGLEYFNCNFCHGRKGQLLHGAPNVIHSAAQ